MAQREEELISAAAEAASSREQVEQLHAELEEQGNAFGETRAEVERLTGELGQREEAVAAAHVETADSREEVERLVIDLAERERALGEASAEVDRLTGELARREEERAKALAAGEAEAVRLRAETDALRAVVAERDSQASLLVAEKAELAAAVAALEEEANRAGEEARRNAALAEDRQQTLAAREHAEAIAKEELGAARAKLAEAETALAELQIRRFVRPRTKWLALSQLGSWLTHPHRGGWRLLGQYLRLRRSGTFAAEAYLAENPDVDASGLDPLMHYVEHGIREGRALAPTPSEAIFAAADVASPAIEPDEPAASAPVPDTPTAEPTCARPGASCRRRGSEPSRCLRRPPAPPPPADYGDFIVLLSRQRSGTTPLRSVLESHSEIFSVNEVFNLAGPRLR